MAKKSITPSSTSKKPLQLQGILVRIAGLWVFAGALTKTFVGLPGDLPSPILQLDFDPLVVLVIAVAVETAIGLLAILAPRRGWIPLAALLCVFAAVLALHMRSGAESCGCFGGALLIPPALMLGIDAALLAGVLATALRGRPWQPQSAFALIAIGTLIAAAILAASTQSRLEKFQPKESATASPSNSFSTPIIATPAAPWKFPDDIPPQVLLRPTQWIGKTLAQTELGRWTDTLLFPPDATVIIYYLSCNHCADHLKDIAEKQAADPQNAPKYVLVQLPTPAGYKGRIFVNERPTGLRVELPAQVKTWVITPPWDIIVTGGIVARAERTKLEGEKP